LNEQPTKCGDFAGLVLIIIRTMRNYATKCILKTRIRERKIPIQLVIHQAQNVALIRFTQHYPICNYITRNVKRQTKQFVDINILWKRHQNNID